MKAYIIGGDKELLNFLPEVEITDDLKEAKIVVFGNGPVVSPSLYKEKKIPEVELKCDINRDRADKAIYTKLRPDQVALGIGRGACFLAVMNGAKLIQYCRRRSTDASSSYQVELRSGGRRYAFPAISDWTQSINLKELAEAESKGFKVLALSKDSVDYITDGDTKRFMKYNGDPEVVKFNKRKSPVSICVQFHPEWMPTSYLSRFVKEVVYGCANS